MMSASDTQHHTGPVHWSISAITIGHTEADGRSPYVLTLGLAGVIGARACIPSKRASVCY